MPIISDNARFYWVGYQELSSDRPPSMSGGLTSIPFTSIYAYTEYLKMNVRETDAFIQVIRALNNRHIALIADKIAEKEKKARASQRPS